MWSLLIVLGVLLGGAWFLPSLLSRGPILSRILPLATADLNGTLKVGSISLGWLSPVVLTDVEIRDHRGEPLLTLPRVTSQRWLVGILCHLSEPGQFRAERPQANIVFRGATTNLEEVLEKYLAPSDKPSADIALSLAVVDGTVTIRDALLGGSWQIKDLQATVSRGLKPEATLAVETSCVLGDQPQGVRVTAGVQMSQVAVAPNAPARSQGQVSLTADKLPLEILAPLAARFSPLTSLSGDLSLALQGQWGKAPSEKNFLQANAAVSNFALTATPLTTDRPRMKQAMVACQVAWDDVAVEVNKLEATCELGRVALVGQFPVGDMFSKNFLTLLRQQEYEFSGQADLAQLARALPATLRLQRSAQIESGQVQMLFSSKRGPQGIVWSGRLDASDLRASHAGRAIQWQQPLQVSLAAHDTPQGPVVDKLKCDSKFLTVEAAGTPNNLAALARFDLNQLAGQLEQLVDLGGMRLGGEGWSHLNWQQSPAKGFEADVELQMRNLALAIPNSPPWNEPQLAAFLSASGKTDLASEARIDNATLHLEAGGDKADVRLTAPVTSLRDGGTWPLEARAGGQLETLLPRLAMWLPLGPWQAAGGYELTARATGSARCVSVEQMKLGVQQLRVAGPGVAIEEPSLEVSASGVAWNRDARQAQAEQITVAASALAAEANRCQLSMPAQGDFTMTGSLKYQGYLERIQPWFVGLMPGDWRLTGRLAGQGQMERAGSTTTAKLDSTVDNFTLAGGGRTQLAEPQVRLGLIGVYNRKDGLIELQKCELASSTVAAGLAGQIVRRQQSAEANISGTVQYDLDRISTLLRPYLGDAVQLAGQHSTPVTIRGPLTLEQVQASAGLGWTSAYAYGVRCGPGEIKAKLANGILQVEPLNLKVNEGDVRLAPALRVAPEPKEFILQPGVVAQKIRLDPNLCNGALKYAAPVVAGVTSAEGQFSLQVDACRIPLNNAGQGELAGRLTIHSMQIEAGPMIREFAVLLGREATARLTQESTINFQMRDGRIYHQGMELVFPELTIRTYGSIGLDQTLAVMAEMPVPPRWIADNPLGASLKNQTVQLPLAGTLEKPTLDRRAMIEASQRFINTAARNVIEDKVKSQIDRLFGPLR